MKPALTAYIGVSAAYWSFMLTDGALRMLVLFYFHGLGYSAIELAFLFLLYEVAGIITNLSAGWIAARFGLASTLFAGLILQIVALVMLVPFADQAGIALSLFYVMCAQGLSGVAKDLTKMSAKSSIKSLVPDQDGQLFRWVALLTGAKNAIKGLGFFVGAALLASIGFKASLASMAAALTIIFLLLMFKLPRALPQGKKDAKFKDVFSQNSHVNWLSLARVFLFAGRDVWFVVALPIFLFTQVYAILGVKTDAFFAVGAFMAIWVIGYGYVQARAPKWLGADVKASHRLVGMAAPWAFALASLQLFLGGWVAVDPNPSLLLICLGLFAFGGVFAINSSLHSYLIIAFAGAGRTSLDVGFYYMANAVGRFVGTLASGICYYYGGLAPSLLLSGLFVLVSALAARKLNH